MNRQSHQTTKVVDKTDTSLSRDKKFFTPILFQFPDILKKSVSSGIDVKTWKKDYLSKDNNIQKYIYNACEAIQVCGISYIKYKEELERYSDEELNRDTGEIVGRNYEIEARLMLRRMLELFIESWQFKEIKNNKEVIFRHFFLIKNLKAFHSRKTNTKEFCDFLLEFDTKAISEIRAELNKLSTQNIFYLANNKDFNKDADVRDLTKSFFKLLTESLAKIPDGQKEMVGGSYQLYAESSEVVHGFSGGPNFNLHNYHQEVQALYARSAVLASSILKHLVDIGENQIRNTDIVEAINELKTVSLPENYRFKVGDRVLVLRQIKAEIIEETQSKYGCKKYKVKYNDQQNELNWSFNREWFLLKELTKL